MGEHRWTIGETGRQLRLLPGILVIVGLVGCASSANTTGKLDGLIHSLEQTPPTDKITVERLLGVKMKLVSAYGADSYVAEGFQLKGTAVTRAEFRELKPGSGFGQSLQLILGGNCVTDREILPRYPNLSIERVPAAHLSTPRQGWWERFPWGQLSLVFRGDTYCLREIVIFVDRA